jgi:iron complex transport system substrate-binding protein
VFSGIGVRRSVVAIVATVLCASACGRADSRDASQAGAAATTGINVTDDAGFKVHLDKPAERIIPLVPSATETLIAIGATGQIVGRTRYDVAPEVAKLPSVGGGVDPSVEAMISLRPDLVISWESDKRQQVREKLIGLGIPVFILRTQDTTDIFRGIANIGRMSGRDSAANRVAASVRATLDSVRGLAADRPSPRVLYVMFGEPPMTVGPHTFIGELMSLAGGQSIFADATQNWPNIAMEEIVRRDPDLLIVPVGEFESNALPRFRSTPGWRDLRAVKSGHVVSVDANLMNRPSPCIAVASRVFLRAIHPEIGQPDSTRAAHEERR